MIGIFDSGMGGAFSLFEFRKICPNLPVCFFADTENLPYGEKSQEELVSLVCKDIDILCEMGAEHILMACCTASTIHSLLPQAYRKKAISIIEPTSAAALKISRNGGIGIISTEATKRSAEFAKFIKNINSDVRVLNIGTPELVTLAESGERDEKLSLSAFEIIKKTLLPFKGSGIDTLILGCTHFAYFERTIENIMNIPVVNSAREGAKKMAEMNLV